MSKCFNYLTDSVKSIVSITESISGLPFVAINICTSYFLIYNKTFCLIE